MSSPISKILDIINISRLSPQKLVHLLGNLMFDIGASIARAHQIEPGSLDELNKRYYQFPSLDTALMLQGLLLLDWKRDLADHPERLFYKENKNVRN